MALLEDTMGYPNFFVEKDDEQLDFGGFPVFPLNSQTIPGNGCRWTFHPCRSRTCLMHCAAVCAASFCRTATRCPVVDGMNEADLDDVQHDWTVAHMDMQGRRG